MPVGLVETPVGFVDPQCPVAWEHPLNRGLVGRWRVIPNSGWRGGLKFRDLTRGGISFNDGTLTNGPTWNGGTKPNGNGSIKFDGSDDYISLGSKLNYAAITYSAWINSSSFSNAYNAVVNRNDNAGTYTEMYVKSNGKLALYLTASFYDGSGTYTLSTNTWYHIVMTYSSTAGLAGYVNGRVDGTAGAGGALSTSAITATIGNAVLIAGRYFTGLIDDVCIYKRALTSVEVMALFKEQKQGSYETLRWVGATTYGIPDQAAPAAGRLSRVSSLEGLGGSGQTLFNPSLSGV